jgi:hypothetical protein
MSFVAAAIAGVATVGAAALAPSGGSGGAAGALPESNSITRGDKNITFNNGIRLEKLQPLLIALALAAAAIAVVRITRKK